MLLGMQVSLGPGDFVLDGDLAPKKGTQLPNFQPMSIVTKRSPTSATAAVCALVETHFQGRVGEAKGGTSPTPDGVENYCCSELNYFFLKHVQKLRTAMSVQLSCGDVNRSLVLPPLTRYVLPSPLRRFFVILTALYKFIDLLAYILSVRTTTVKWGRSSNGEVRRRKENGKLCRRKSSEF